MDQLVSEKLAATAACSCPREQNETLVTPRCAVEQLISSGTSILFVKSDGRNGCKSLFGFGHGHFCTCPNRAEFYKKFKE